MPIHKLLEYVIFLLGLHEGHLKINIYLRILNGERNVFLLLFTLCKCVGRRRS